MNVEQFWSNVDKKSDECWTWSGATQRGYGMLHFEGKTQRAHRVSYTLSIGPIPDGLVIDHLCRNKRCVRPSHLEPVTQSVNVTRAWPRNPVPDDVAAEIMSENQLLTTAECALVVGISVQTISRWVAIGRLTPARKLPGLRGPYLFDPSDIDALRDSA
jgi:hypothetical protein